MWTTKKTVQYQGWVLNNVFPYDQPTHWSQTLHCCAFSGVSVTRFSLVRHVQSVTRRSRLEVARHAFLVHSVNMALVYRKQVRYFFMTQWCQFLYEITSTVICNSNTVVRSITTEEHRTSKGMMAVSSACLAIVGNKVCFETVFLFTHWTCCAVETLNCGYCYKLNNKLFNTMIWHALYLQHDVL